MKPRAAIIGNGSWGTAFALTIRQACQTSLWGPIPEEIESCSRQNENLRYLPGFKLDGINISPDISKVLIPETEFVIIAIPTKFLRKTLDAIKNYFLPGYSVISLVKGVEDESFKTPLDIIKEVTGCLKLSVISGPSHAEEVACRKPAAVVCSSCSKKNARRIQECFSSDTLRIYTNTDTRGTEIAGAVKNVIAIAAGIVDGLELGSNAKAAMMTRGLVEMIRFGTFFRARKDTFFGLAGIGDLITTCASGFSRNRHVGEQAARGKTLPEIESSMNMIAEGINTVQAVMHLARKKKISMPISEAVYKILFNGKDSKETVRELMTRDPKDE